MTGRDRKKLEDAVCALPLFSSHEHYYDLSGEGSIDVNTLIANSYLDEEWTFLSPGNDRASRATFLDALRSNWGEDRTFEPAWDETRREEGYRGWKKAVERAMKWVD